MWNSDEIMFCEGCGRSYLSSREYCVNCGYTLVVSGCTDDKEFNYDKRSYIEEGLNNITLYLEDKRNKKKY